MKGCKLFQTLLRRVGRIAGLDDTTNTYILINWGKRAKNKKVQIAKSKYAWSVTKMQRIEQEVLYSGGVRFEFRPGHGLFRGFPQFLQENSWIDNDWAQIAFFESFPIQLTFILSPDAVYSR
jgi:hypothetical protein